MSLSWTFLTKSFLPLRYRDTICGIVIGKFVFNKYAGYHAEQQDNYVLTRMYTHDESDLEFREANNMTDSAVRREKSISFANMIRDARARQERELMLDAYNYLNGKSH